MKQLVVPNFSVVGIPGWCLKYVDDAGGAPNSIPPRTSKASYAYTNELNARRISQNIDSPVGIWVVGFLAFTTGPYTVEGHVFFMKHLGNSKYDIRDSEVGSETRKPYGSLAEIVAWFGAYKPKYLGYSTNCDGVQYAEGDEVADIINLDTARILAAAAGTSDGFDGRVDAHGGGRDDDLKKNHVGKELTNEYISEMWFKSKEAAQRRSYNQQVYADRDSYAKRFDEAMAKIQEMEASKPGGDSESEKKLQALKEALDAIIK